MGDLGSTPGSGRSPGGENGYPLQTAPWSTNAPAFPAQPSGSKLWIGAAAGRPVVHGNGECQGWGTGHRLCPLQRQAKRNSALITTHERVRGGGAGAAGEFKLTEDMQTPEMWEDKKFLE